MKEELNQAIELIKATNDQVSRLIDKIQDEWDGNDHDLAHKVYVIASYLNMFASHLSGESKTYEGPVEVNNARSSISIDGFEVRGDVQFELLEDGNWIKGHRENSQYGQVFMTQNYGEGSGVILCDAYRGRVTLPLTMDNGINPWVNPSGNDTDK